MRNSPFAIIILSLLVPAWAQAFDLSILKNDKESVTHVFTQKDLKYALQTSGSTSAAAFTILGEALSDFDESQGICDAELFLNFTLRLQKAGLDYNRDTITQWLEIWRSQNLIDDLFFEIINQISNLKFNLETIAPFGIRNRDLSRATTAMDQSGLTLKDLQGSYSGLTGLDPSRLGCSPNTWSSTARELQSASRLNDYLHLTNIYARTKGIINDQDYVILETYRYNGVQNWRINLQRYLRNLRNIKNKYRSSTPSGADLSPNELSSSIIYKHSNLTYRQSLYYRFDSTQISLISDLLRRTFDRMDARKAELVFTYTSGSETIPISPMGQYFFARELLKKEMTELNQSSLFAGSPFTYEDLVTAALETGLINHELIDSVLKIDDLWNPVVKPWTKIANYAFQITGNASVFLPPPYNIISSVALFFIEGIVTRKNQQASQADPNYDPF